jgi:thiol-disulfide isomerase/thioredoxin
MKIDLRKLLKHRATKLALEIGIFILLYLGVRTYMQWHLVSGPLPPIQSVTLSGKPFDSLQARKKPLLVHFWASWCPICRVEQNSIESISHDYPIISIAMNSGDAIEVRHFLQQQGLDFPVINDPEGELAKQFGVTGVPVSFVVNDRNQIRFVERGYTTEWGLRLRLWLANF